VKDYEYAKLTPPNYFRTGIACALNMLPSARPRRKQIITVFIYRVLCAGFSIRGKITIPTILILVPSRDTCRTSKLNEENNPLLPGEVEIVHLGNGRTDDVGHASGQLHATTTE
jgi:hypothetical protein